MKTVLLAYEREQDLNAVEAMLKARGHQVLRARNGVEALEHVRRDGPSVVVSDVLLPKLDGFALTRRIKEDPLVQHIPVLLHTMRFDGPKYEAFAAEVGAERFLSRSTKLEAVVEAVEGLKAGSGTMRMPAIVPELLERREQDRKRLAEVEQQARDLVHSKTQLVESQRMLREEFARVQQESQDRESADAAMIRELQTRVRDLETLQQKLADAESRARGVAADSQAELARVSLLESRMVELQAARARAQATAADAERVLTMLPLPTWICDMESLQLIAVSDSAAALFDVTPEKLRGRSLREVWSNVELNGDALRPVTSPYTRPGGDTVQLELRRQSISHGGRACWLMVARDVTQERTDRAAGERVSLLATAADRAIGAFALADTQGRLTLCNEAFLGLVAIEDPQASLTLEQFETRPADDANVRSAAVAADGKLLREAKWKRADGSLIDVEVSTAALPGSADVRVVSVRDITHRRRLQDRAERDQRRLAELLDLTQRAHGMNEPEVLAAALKLLEQITDSPIACAFLAAPDAPQLELAARTGSDVDAAALTVLSRWRGVPPAGTALFDCASTLRPVTRDAAEGTGALQQTGLPETLQRQLAVPVMEGNRLAGVLLLADKSQAYDDEDRRHAAFVAEALWKLMRRRRLDSEVVSAMEHMERVMMGAIEALAQSTEIQDGLRTGRSRRVSDLAVGIGAQLALPGHTLRGLKIVGQLIDVGMMQVPREILWRPGPLSAGEFELVKTHAERGYEALRRIEFPWPVAEAVRQHHERVDGSGYPRGLRGDDILLEARIVAVADAVEAMLSSRPHRTPLSLGSCIEELHSQAGRRYDARVVSACVKLLRDREAGQSGNADVGQRIA
jgi:response regulator RpfG family c-di-GMP phosphodiesterase